MIATHRNIPLYSFDPTIDCGEPVPIGGGKRVGELCPSKGPIIVIDDSVNMGDSLACAKEFMPYARTAAVYVRPDQAKYIDYVGVKWPLPHWFEWHFFGSDLIEKCAFDLDGIICHDCPDECDNDGKEYYDWINLVRPKWLPRPHVIPKIVTARLEKYRGATEFWLYNNDVHYDELVMCPCETLEERSAFDICRFKADVVRKSDLMAFIESDSRQAKAIFQWSKKPVVCPPSGQTFQ